MKRLGMFLLAKDVNAIVIAFLCAFLQIFHIYLGIVAILILALVTLQKGPKSGLLVLSWIALPAVALFVLRHVGESDFLFLHCIIIWFFASLLHRFNAWSMVLTVAALVGVASIVLLHLFVPQLPHWWVKEITVYLQRIDTHNADWRQFASSPAALAERLAPIASGIGGFFLVGASLLEVMLARFWQYSMTTTVNFRREFVQIRIGRYATIVAIFLVIGVLFRLPVAIDAILMLLFPFFLAGLSLMHYWFSKGISAIVMMVFVYAGLLILPVILISGLAILAALDAWFNFRNRDDVVAVSSAR